MPRLEKFNPDRKHGCRLNESKHRLSHRVLVTDLYSLSYTKLQSDLNSSLIFRHSLFQARNKFRPATNQSLPLVP
jgi:hypothetical protein